jgi:hypothetical protein
MHCHLAISMSLLPGSSFQVGPFVCISHTLSRDLEAREVASQSFDRRLAGFPTPSLCVTLLALRDAAQVHRAHRESERLENWACLATISVPLDLEPRLDGWRHPSVVLRRHALSQKASRRKPLTGAHFGE